MINTKKVFNILFCVVWMYGSLLSYVRGLLDSIAPLVSFYDTLLVFIICLLSLLLLPRLLALFSYKNAVFFLVVIITFELSKKNELVSGFVTENSGFFFLQVLPFYLLGMLLLNESNERLYKSLYWISNITIVLSTIYLFYYVWTGRSWSGIDQMNMAYSILPYILFSIWCSKKSKNRFAFLLLFISFFNLIALGNRGSLLIAIVWYVICLFRSSASFKTKFAFLGLAVILATFYYVGINSFFGNLEDSFASMGFNVRIFQYLNNNSFFDGNGRNELLQIAVKSIKESPYSFKGLYYDQYIAGVYVHNLFFEIWLDFGIIIGAIICLWLIVKCFYSLKNTTGYIKDFLLLTIVFVFFKLMMSSSFLQEPFFFLLLGLISNTSDKRGTNDDNQSIVTITSKA